MNKREHKMKKNFKLNIREHKTYGFVYLLMFFFQQLMIVGYIASHSICLYE